MTKIMNKERQHAQYELHGGTMTIEQWEDDSRYDKSLHIDTLEKKEQEQAELIMQQNKDNESLLENIEGFKTQEKWLKSKIKELENHLQDALQSKVRQIESNELLYQHFKAQLTAIGMLFDICSSGGTHRQKTLFTNQAKYIINQQIEAIKTLHIIGESAPNDLPF